MKSQPATLVAVALARFFLRSPGATLTVFVGVALAVTSVVAVHRVSGFVADSVASTSVLSELGLSGVAYKDVVTADDYFSLRQRWRGTGRTDPDAGSRGGLDGIELMTPFVDGVTLLRGKATRVVGVDWFGGFPGLRRSDGAPDVSAATPAPQGVDGPVEERVPGSDSAPATPVADAECKTTVSSIFGVLADRSLGFQPGECIYVNGHQYPVLGLLSLGGATVIADVGVAQKLLGWPDSRLSFVGLRYTRGTVAVYEAVESLMPGLTAAVRLPTPELPDDWRVLPEDAFNPSVGFARSVLFNLGALSTLALVVSWFLIYQVAVTWVHRVEPVFASLHAVGVARALPGLLFIGAVVMIGLVATLVGLVTGAWLAAFLAPADLLAERVAPGLAGVLESTVGDVWLVGKAVVSGVVVAGFATMVAFWQRYVQRRSVVSTGRRSRPSKSGSQTSSETQGFWWSATLANLRPLWPALASLAIAIVCFSVESTGIIGAYLGILAMCVAVGTVVPPLMEALRSRSRRLTGPLLMRLGFREAVWYPAELSVALGALILAVATSMAVALMVESFRGDFSLMLDQRLSHDVFVRRDGEDLSAVAVVITQEVPGIQSVQLSGDYQIRIDGKLVEISYAKFDDNEAARYGFGRALAANEVLASDAFLMAFSVGVGDRIDLEGRSRVIAGRFPGFGEVYPRVLVDVAAVGAPDFFSPATVLDSLSIKAVQPERVSHFLQERFPLLQVSLQSEVRRQALSIFDRTFAITGALTTVALLVAAIGVFNAILALRLNQRASSHLLNVLGVTDREITVGDVCRSLGIASVALMAALPLGLLMGWALCDVVNPRAFGWRFDLSLSASAIVVPIVACLASCVIAGLASTPLLARWGKSLAPTLRAMVPSWRTGS